MRLTKTFLKFALPVIVLTLAVIHQGLAQVTYTSKNTATANGNVGTVQVTDVSNNGATVNRLLGDQTPVNFPMIGISETVAAPTLKADGSYDVVYTFLIQNYGAIDLKTVNAVNNITTVFTSPLTYTVISLTSNSGTLTANPAFNGNSDKNLLVAASSTLASGASGSLTLTVNVAPHGQYGTFNSASTTSAVTNNADAVAVADASTNNTSPNHGDGTKTPLNFTDPTPVALNPSDIQITKVASTTTPNAGDNVTFTITAQNLGPGDAAPVVVNDALNTTGFTLVSATPSQGTFDSGTGIWSVGTLTTSSQATLTVVATVLPDKPAGVYTNTASSNHPGDPVSSNNSSTVTLTPQPVADLRITNTDNKQVYVPGTNNTYTVVASNTGPSNAAGSTVTYTLPAGITGTWTAIYAGGATGNASGTNNINEIVNLPTGSTVTYTIAIAIPSSQAGNFTTVATVATPTGVNDLTQGNNTATDNDIRLGDADLAITNTDGKTMYTPGVGNTYTIVATNNGISDVTGANITYPLPAGVTSTWTAVYAGGATGNANGTNSINELVNIPVGATVTYTVVAAIPSSQSGNLTTVATIATPSGVVDPTTANNSASDIDTQHSIVDLGITNTDGKTIYVPGVTNTYTLVATNTGPSDATGSVVTYTLPTGITGTWTAAYTGGATGNASGTNNINETVNIPVGATVTYTVAMPILSSETRAVLTTTATIAAAADVTDSAPGNNSAGDTDTRVGGADLSITNTDSQTTYTPGTSNTYTVVATNNGPSDITNATITYPIPTNSIASWAAVYTGGATGIASGNGSINAAVNMPAGSTITYTVTAAIPSTQTGAYTTTATITLPAGSVDPTPANNTAADTDTQNSQADLTITNTDGKTNYSPGTTNTYTVVATNTGPSDAPGSTITYTLPAGGVTSTWTAIYTGGATGNVSGTNNITETVNMPASGTVTYTIIATIPSSQTGTLTTVATVTAPASVSDLTPSNNTANDVDVRLGDADLSITNTDNKLTYTPGTNSTYTVVAGNAGPSDVNATVTYTLPAGVTASWTVVYNGGTTGNASGTNNINETIHIPSGGTATYTVVAAIPSGQIGQVVTTASIAPPATVTDPVSANDTAVDTDLKLGDADLSITNTDGQTNYIPGINNTYTIVATNNGPSDVINAVVAYPLPSGVTASWSAVYTGGATGNTGGTNSINETVNMPVGSTITYTVLAKIPASQSGSLTTTATITPPSGSVDQTTANNTATDTDTQNSTSDLSITNTDGKVIYIPGITNTYTVVASNAGPSNAPGTIVSYVLPPGITGTWTAAYAGGATGNASGTNNINETVNIPSGGTITYTIVVPVPSSQTGTSFTTTATIAAATGISDPTTANNTAIDTDTRIGGADLSVTNTDGQTTYTPGTTNVYTVVASNNGPSDVVNANISYLSTSGLTGSWSAAFTGGATGDAGGIVSGAGNANELVNMPAGSTITYTIILNIPANKIGPFTTTASISLPSGSVDPTSANNTATDTDTQNSVADLVVANTDGQTTYTPGTNNTYTVVATNNGPSDAPASTLTYTLPVGATGTWTATYAGGATGNASGTNNINETVNMPAGSSITYTVTAAVPSSQTGLFTTVATVATPSGITDPTPANNTAVDHDLRNSDADLSITNTDNKTIYIPGTTNTYTVVATNAGPSDAVNTTVTYTLPAGVTSNWTAVFAGAATGNASGTNNITETVSMPSGSTITYTVVVPVPSGQTGALFTTTASITSTINDPTTTNNTANDNDVRVGGADVSITNTDGQTTYVPGTTNTYTLVTTNNGPSDVVGATVTYPFPSGLTGSWTAVFAGGATGNASGTNSINETVNMPSGSTIIYTVTAAVASAQTGSITTTASISLPAGSIDPTPANNTATDVDTQNSQVDLSITNTDGQTTYTPGTTNTYTVVATNNGPSDAPGSAITYTLPTGLTTTWAAVYSGGATGNTSGNGNINENVNFPAGSSVTYTVTAAIASNVTGTVTATATVIAASGITDGTPANNTASDTDTQNSQADLSITNTDGQTTYTPGTTNTYVAIATNNGPSDAPGTIVTYTLPTGVTGTWTAVYAGGATGNNASGIGNINETVNLPSGGSITYTITAAIASNVTGTVSTTATITAANGITDATINNNTAVDIDTQNSQVDLSITNTDGQATYTPGTTNTYTVVATNTGPSDASGSTITYPMPTGITGTWTAVYTNGATGNASGAGSISENVNMPTGSTVTYTVTAAIASNVTGAITTTATITAASGITDGTPGNNTASDTDTQNSQADLSITNTDGKLTYIPGTTNTYTVVATNNGPSDALASTITYPMPTGVTGTWTATYSGSATGNASGTGNISETVDLPSGSSVTYTVTATIASNVTGPVTTTATITAAGGITDDTPGNNTASDTDLQNSQADLGITNTDGQLTYTPGTTNTYTIVATNAGPSDALGSTITYPMPTGITGTWTATYAGGATGNASGNGSVNESVNLPSGGSITYTVTAAVASNVTGPLTTTATITTASGITDGTPGNNTASDTDIQNSQADLSITNTDGQTTYTPGVNNTYTVVATNNGPSDAPGSTVNYTLPSGINGTWTAAYTGGATGNASGTNNINETVNMPSGSTITYTVIASIPANKTGTFTTTAVISAAPGINDATSGNNTAIDIDNQSSQADLSITNTDGQLNYTPGTNNTYTVVATNNGPSDAPGSSITYLMPTGLTGTWTAAYTGGATGNVSGTGSINETVNMPAGGTVTYTVTANIASNVTGPVTTTATIAAAVGVTDPTPGNNTASDTDIQNSQADLSITNTDGKTIYVPGTANTYTVVATNAGPSDAPGTTVAYTLPAGITGSWTAAYTGGATGNASGTNNINETVNMPSGSTITYTVVVPIPSGQTGALFATTATITPLSTVTDATLANNTATDNDVRIGGADLSITNTDSKLTYVPGVSNIYTVVATNNGPSDVVNGSVTYTIPAGTNAVWTAVYTGGATGNASGTNNINETVNMPLGSTITYTVIVAIPSAQAGVLTTTASINLPFGSVDPTPANNTAADADTQASQADLSITNTDGQTTYIPGTTNTYTVVAANTGPSDAPGTTVAYTLPVGVTGTWNAVYTGGATGNASGTNNINETVSMPTGSTITYTIIASIPSSQTGIVTTTATITPASSVTDATLGNNTAGDNDLRNSQADLSITNTDNKIIYTPGIDNTYTVTATNSGPSDALGSTITYAIPSGSTATWTAVYTGGAGGNAGGTNNINETVDMPSGSTVIYTVIVSVPSSQTGIFSTVANITPAAGITDATTANNSATDNDGRISQVDLAITNTDGKLTYTPGTTNTYTVVATNNGPSDAFGATIAYTLPTGINGAWTAAYTSGATGNASGTNNISETVNMPVGSTITYTVIATIPSTQVGSFSTTATITSPTILADLVPANNTATDVDLKNSVIDLKIVKTASNTTPSINTQVTFTLAVGNNGPSEATNVSVADLLPSGFIYISSVPSTGTYNNSTGVWTIGNVDITDNPIITILASVNGPGNHVNTATVSGAESDSNPLNNTSLVIILPKQLPVANNDVAATNPNTAVTIAVLANDVQAETALVPSSVTVITPTQHGTVTIDPATGNAIYTPATNYFGPDSFTYTVMDANGGTSNVATVTITINKPPVANNDSALTSQNVPVQINLLVNDVKGDANLAPATVQIVQLPVHGALTIDPATGITTYNPNLGYYGADNFTYTVKDQNGAISNVANVAITILKPITAVNDNATTNPNTPVTINILSNDIPGDVAIDPTTVTVIQQPGNGKVVINATTGVAVYTPATNYYGDDQFTYTVKDKNGFASNIATVTIKINDAPIIGLAKAAASVVKALNGSYNVTYLLTVGNYGLADLSSISITDDLSQTFRGETWKVTGIKTLGNLTVNPNYDGQAIIEMLQGTNTLNVGQIEQIQVTVNVVTVDAATSFLNRAYAAGTSVTGLQTTDQSTNGYRADPIKGGDVSPSDPTPVELPKPCIRIPAGFSPNSDGVHDNWVIEGTCIVGGVNMEIYNRWGNLVYKDANYKNDWNGKCNQGIHIGEDLPVGTYYYIVTVSGNDKYVGYLTLNR